MTEHDRSRRSPGGALNPIGGSQRLLAAVSLLGASLGVSAAAPAAPMAAADDAAIGGLVVKIVDNKSGTPGASQGFTYQNNGPAFQSNQFKSQSNQIKSNQFKFQSDQIKGNNALPAVQSNQFKR
jgi:hypothetical protein